MTARPRVCFLTSKNVLKDREGVREDWFEYELEFGALKAACEAEGIDLVSQVWDEPFDATAFDLCMIGTVWDAAQYHTRFVSFIKGLEQICPVLNSPALVEWNIDKSYLRQLEEAGAPSIPTLWVDAATQAAVDQAFVALGTDQVVIKPLVGAGAWRQVRLKQGEALPDASKLPLADCMIQPFLPSVPEEGEYSLLIFGGWVSHGVIKRAKQGDYRVQSIYGATEAVWEPTSEEIGLAQDVMRAAETITGDKDPLYARVDMVRGLDGRLAVIELELVEPYFYPEQGPNMGAVFVEALKEKLGI